MIKPKKKIAFVNIFYPPKTLGGATRIVVDEVSTLANQYSDDFELVVFTADTESSGKYKLTVYPYDGYRVYALAVALTVSTNWHEKDEEVAVLFDNFLAFEQPDLVHFHCIQALTGSIVEVTQKRGIPHFITVHDAWWISDHQFLMDQLGRVYPDGHPDPFEPFTLREGVTLEQSLKRRVYLKGLLSASNGVLAVSETFRQIYAKNGVTNVVTNKNGISDQVAWAEKNTCYSEKVICAHIGSMSPHKGFDLFKAAVQTHKFSNIEILVVDHTKEQGYLSQSQWGNTNVTIVGRVNQENIQDLYRRIDVLFAPSICLESFGLVTREAAACGCWVVGSDVGAIGEDITPENGFRISPTTENLQVVLHEIDRAPKKYKGLSKSGHIRYSSDQVQELVDMFNAIFVN
ncbi:MAG: glycosyltransferase family 4 protein [Methylococcaceae bacterium]|nr:glycosyltransferase family 4 protein [Methylococcaceae bacterium]